MTRSLRQRHRRIMLALAVLLPAVLVGGLLARRAVPITPDSALPLELRSSQTLPR